jgi:hypothetical protein
VCWRTDRPAKAEDCFARALETQTGVIADFPEVPAHDRVVLEFLRLRLAEVRYDRAGNGNNASTTEPSRDLLDTCIENLTELIAQPELNEDRLASTSLEAAYDILARVLDQAGQKDQAEEAKRRAEEMRAKQATGQSNPWGL